MSNENTAAASTSCKNCNGRIAGFSRAVAVTFVLCSLAPIVRCMDNLGLLMGTLMTHRQISCLDKSISLRCPNGTNVVLNKARYVVLPNATYANIRDFNICDTIAAGAINNSLLVGAVGETSAIATVSNAGVCQWHDLLQHSLLQTAVEVCHSKQQCQFQVSPSKSGYETCPREGTFVRVEYNCRPSSFSSKVGCEHEKVNFECEPYTRLAIYSASYGRTQYQSVQCPQPQGVAEETCLLSYATEIVIDHCHGKRNCTLVADSKTFMNPCKEKSRVYLKVVYACVPRKVLLAKYEESAFRDEEYPYFEEVGDPHDVLDNPKSLAPFPDQTNHVSHFNQSNENDITLLHHLTSNTIHNSTFGDSGEKLYVYLIGGASGVFISLTVFVIARLIWKRRRTRNDDKLRDMNLADKSLPHSFNDEICEVDADVTLAQIMPAVTIIPSHHHISSPSEVVRYGKDDIVPRSLYQDDNSQFYYG